jgi:LysR family transcriptional regulator, glycine cleavage system transcriptional activator
MERSRIPLNALRTFEAVARHLSIKGAADELCVTPGAVSQMIKSLEQHLGVPLFQRANRALLLTDAGRNYLPPIRNAFRQIADASRRVTMSVETGLLTVSVTPFFASAWLVPRLREFHQMFPEIDLQVVTSDIPVDFSRSGVEIAVRHGLGRYPGLTSDRIISVEVVPVAARSIVKRLGMPKDPGELAQWPLVHDAERKGWERWFQAQGIDKPAPARGPSFDDSGLRLQAILAGQGVGLLPAAMVETHIAEGRLIRLASDSLLEDFAYYLVCPIERRDQPKIATFRNWILRVAERSARAEPTETSRDDGTKRRKTTENRNRADRTLAQSRPARVARQKRRSHSRGQ